MQDIPAKKRRNYSGRVYRPRTCQECQEVFTPQGSSQKLCPGCRERRDALAPIRVIPDRACLDCGVTFAPQKSVSRRCAPCQDTRSRMLRLESCRRKRAERKGDEVIVRYCEDCGAALVKTPAKRCQDCRLARFQRDLERREERQQAAEVRRAEQPAPRLRRQPKPVAVPVPKVCADCGTALPDGRRKRCDPCRAAHDQVIRLARNARRMAGYLPTGPRTSWPPAAGLEPRICRVCSEEFQPYRDNQLECSRKCRDAHPERMQWRRDNSSRSAARPANKARANDRRRGTEREQLSRRKQRLRRYGLTIEQYDAMLADQQGLCALCGKPPSNPDGIGVAGRLHVDHDHETGRVRSLLCLNCNHGVGSFRDDPEVMRRAAEYVERFRAIALT